MKMYIHKQFSMHKPTIIIIAIARKELFHLYHHQKHDKLNHNPWIPQKMVLIINKKWELYIQLVLIPILDKQRELHQIEIVLMENKFIYKKQNKTQTTIYKTKNNK